MNGTTLFHVERLHGRGTWCVPRGTLAEKKIPERARFESPVGVETSATSLFHVKQLASDFGVC